MVEGHMMQNHYTVVQGDPLDIVWSPTGLYPTSTGITLDFPESSVLLEYPDGTSDRLMVGPQVTLVNRQWDGNMTAEIHLPDTWGFQVGRTKYTAKFAHVNGFMMLEEEGTITVTAPTTVSTAKPVRPWDLLNPNEEKSSPELQQSRLDICATCPALKLGICTACGCVVKWKSSLARAACPVGKW
jgi:hypothetical protein